MPDGLRKARLHLFAAAREIHALHDNTPVFDMALNEVKENADRAVYWLNEYTEEVTAEPEDDEPTETADIRLPEVGYQSGIL
jgi:hypothetical protein